MNQAVQLESEKRSRNIQHLGGAEEIRTAGGAKLKIGDNVGISGATIYARKKITIGENTCIGGNCKILDNDFHPIEAEARNKLLRDENGGEGELSYEEQTYQLGEGDCVFIDCRKAYSLRRLTNMLRQNWYPVCICR